jgi:hypothetical protein
MVRGGNLIPSTARRATKIAAMKMKRSVLSAACAAWLIGGCVVQTINPLFGEKDFIFQPGLAGTWVQKEENKEQGTWVFEQDGRHYNLTHTDEKGSKATFKVAAGRLGTNVFLNSMLEDPMTGTNMNDFAAVHLVPTYTFIRLRKTAAGMTFAAMNLEWLSKLLEENPKSIAHVMRKVGEDKIPLLTASTEDLQKFVTKYADDEKAFGNEIKLVPRK